MLKHNSFCIYSVVHSVYVLKSDVIGKLTFSSGNPILYSQPPHNTTVLSQIPVLSIRLKVEPGVPTYNSILLFLLNII